MNPLTVLQKQKKEKTNWTCILDFEILTKTLWLQGTIVKNSLISHLQMMHAPISNSALV